MNKLDSILVQHLTTSLLFTLVLHNQAATIIQNPKLANMDDGFLELKPNGSIILRNTFNNSSNVWQETLIFKVILNAINLMPLAKQNTFNDLNQKIYGDGVEHKFPPFLERVIQRIQTYFSIYKYTDTSQPVREDLKSTSTTTATTMKSTSASSPGSTTLTTSAIATAPLTLDQQNEIEASLSSSSIYYGFNGETSNTSTSSTTETSTLVDDALEDEENEFIEIKDRKLLANKNS